MTIAEEDFVNRSVAHQVGVSGGVTFRTDLAARRHAEQRSSGMALAWNGAAGSPFPFNGWKARAAKGDLLAEANEAPGFRDKMLGSLREILDAGARGSIMIDMQDRRVRSVLSPEKSGHPVFCFNRLAGDAGRILWPLPRYHDLGSEDFLGNLDPDRIDWSSKFDRFAWRGIVSGRASLHLDTRRKHERLKPLLRKFKSGKVDQVQAQERLLAFPRFLFVDRYLKDDRAELGFVDGGGLRLGEEVLLASYQKARISREDFQRFKYLVVLRGQDVGSSFFWTMNSGSLGLVMETPFETFASVHFEPWVHYVPFKEDLSDFEDNLAWCQSHQDECHVMTKRAAEVCKLLARPDLRAEILRRVVAEVNRLTGQ